MNWWRRNGIALALALVLAAGTLGANWWLEWSATANLRFWQPMDGNAAAVTSFAGAGWDNIRTSRLDAKDSASLRAPSATLVIAAGVRVTAPAGGGPYCSLTLREVSGQQRSWTSADGLIDWPDTVLTECDHTLTAPYTVGAGFLVPQDATGPFYLEVDVPDAAPRYLRYLVNV